MILAQVKAGSGMSEDGRDYLGANLDNLKERRATLMNRLTNKSVDNDLNFFKNSAFVKSRRARKCAERVMHIFVIIILTFFFRLRTSMGFRSVDNTVKILIS